MSALVGLLVALAVVAAAGTGGRRVRSDGRERPAVRPARRVAAPDLSAVLLGVCAQLRAGAAPGEAWSRIVGSTATATATATATVASKATTTVTMVPRPVPRPVPGSVPGSVPAIEGLLAATSGPGRVRGLGGHLRPPGLPWLRGVPGFGGLRWLDGGSDDGAVQRARAVQAAARLSDELGAPLAGVLERIASAVAADEEADGERRAALSGPRSTAQVLAWLPLLGVALGALLGADPVGIILAGGLGTASAVLGAVMLLLGRSWTAALLARAGRAGADLGGVPQAPTSPVAASASPRRVSHRGARRSTGSATPGIGLRAVRERP